DMKMLGIKSVTRYARASDFIPEIILQVERLIKQSFAYIVNNSVYFRINKFKDYGKLSGQKLTKLKIRAKKLADRDLLEAFGKEKEKESPLDFALWKASGPEEPGWKSPWGRGRPGWHIEDTAISEKFFGPQYDIHGGGIDLIFPHHECEIAQQESASGKKPFVRYWLHTGHLKVGGEKMSKSLGNFITIQELLKKSSPETFRLIVAQAHYRSPINYTEKLQKQAEASRQRLIEFVLKIKSKIGFTKAAAVKGDILGIKRTIYKARKDFYDALRDDFNTPKAIAVVFSLVNKLNPKIDKGIEDLAKKEVEKFLKEVDGIFGIIGKLPKVKPSIQVVKLVVEREKLRKEKKWGEADKIRERVLKLGWQIEDTAFGPRLKKQ
ncbi:MAG: cysteine--tRNA ligase, partial [Candidatus Paceibacteria bacterium]